MFSRDAYIDEQHEQALSIDYFAVIGTIKRNPRYINKRCMDPQFKCFLDETQTELLDEWGLPNPNSAAAYKSLAKYAKDIMPMSVKEIEDMNLAWSFTERHFGYYMGNSDILDYEMAKAKMDMSTSSGAPFNQHYSKKSELFEKDEDIDSWLQEDWNTIGTNPDWTCLFTNSLKEEIRPAEKIQENSQRTFLSGGVDAVVHGTRLFVNMNEKFYASFLSSASAVGMSPYKGNWDRLFRKLNIFKNGYALDESQYDSSLRAFLMWACALLRWRMLKPQFQTAENLMRLRNYYRNLVNTMVIGPDGIIIQKKGGNPSGSVNTITDNTLILYALLAYAWIRNAPKEYRTYESFELHTAKCLVGDDNTWTVSDEAHTFFNARSVIATWKKIGVTTTTDSLDARRAAELDFLSAHTIFMNGKALPIYNIVKMMTTLLYAPRELHTPAITLERTAALLSVGWTNIPFRRFCRDVIDWLTVKYDKVMVDDPRWILAKCQIQSDATYYKLFMGEEMLLRPQGVPRKAEKDNQALENVSMSTQKRQRSRRQRRAAAPVVVIQQKAMPAPAKQKQGKRRASNAQGIRVRSRPRRGPRNGRQSSLTARQGAGNAMRGKRTCTIVEDEFITTVFGSTNFTTSYFPINPAQAATFPWLSKQAPQWEKYHFNHLEFYYKRTVSEFATNGTTGKVMLSVDFDASDPPPTNKQQVEDTDPHVDNMPCNNIRLPMNQRRMHGLYRELYNRPGPVPGATDIKTYDAGNFYLSTQGNQNNTEVGELHVRYSVTFSVPILESDTSIPRNNTVSLFTESVNPPVFVNGAFVTVPYSGMGSGGNGVQALNPSNAGVFTLPRGIYLVDWLINVLSPVATTNLNIRGGLSVNGVFDLTSEVETEAESLGPDLVIGAAYTFVSTGSNTVEILLQPTWTGAAPTGFSSFIRFVAV